MRSETVLRTALAGLLLLALTACGGPGYDPLPEATLYADIEAIPGVTDQNIDSFDSTSEGTGYSGPIFVDNEADPVAVLDQVLAILWQGLPEANPGGVRVIDEDGTRVDPSDVGLIVRTDIEARYGPQPGTGEPPTDKPSLKLEQ